MKKTIIKIIVALVVCVAIFFGIKTFTQPKTTEGSKEITITLTNQGEKVGTVTEKTDAELLSDFLIELQKNGEIQLEYEDSEYGMYITGMGIDKVINQDEEKGLYWTYTSDNNKACKEAGYCDAASSLAIEDGDSFSFTLAAY